MITDAKRSPRAVTLAIVEHHHDDRYEALYLDGRLIAAAEDGPLTSAGVLQALAAAGALSVDYVDLQPEYDDDVVVQSGWPERLDEIPVEVRI